MFLRREKDDRQRISRSSAKDFKSRAANLIRRRTTEANLSEKSLIPSREDVQSWEESFDALLRHRCKERFPMISAMMHRRLPLFFLDGQALFRAFLRTEFSEENLEFWLACDEFRSCKEPKRSAKAKKIYMDFIAIGAPKQVRERLSRRRIFFDVHCLLGESRYRDTYVHYS